MSAVITGIHHVQLAMPRGREDEARAFFVGILGMTERPKPPDMAKRGGAWFFSGTAEVHLGVEDDFRPARKAHPALLVADLASLMEKCAAAGFEIVAADPLAGFTRRAFATDPFGNRIELLEPAAR